MSKPKNGLMVLTLSATNKRAVRVYEKVGFLQTDMILKEHFKEGEYIDDIIMTLRCWSESLCPTSKFSIQATASLQKVK